MHAAVPAPPIVHAAVPAPPIVQAAVPAQPIAQASVPAPSPQAASHSAEAIEPAVGGQAVQYHTSAYGRSGRFLSTDRRWGCCKERDPQHPGCHRGPVMKHHPRLWDGYTYLCCGDGERRSDGCTVGRYNAAR